MPEYRCVEVTDEEMLKQVFAFRYKILLEIFPQYIQAENFKDELEYDKYDTYSLHFVALDKEDNICGNIRLVNNSPIGYPTENHADFDKSQFQREKLGELSRIFIDAKCRSMKSSKTIIDSFKEPVYNKLKEFGIEYTYGSLEENFLRLLKIYGLDYHPIGPLQEVGLFGERYPCILYTKELGENLGKV
jgi:N-acyl-L-homoserine lactone synthetase